MLMKQRGCEAEQRALDFLIEKKLKLITRNYFCRHGEVDLIMRDDSFFVFVEVRSRNNLSYGNGLESITYAKKIKIIRSSIDYMIRNNIMEKYPMRFDVMSMDKQEITWIKDAFGEDY